MTTEADVRWGKYDKYEGPYLLGKKRYVLPPEATSEQKFLAVITATEGGTYESVNAYDRCSVSTGIIQLCEQNYFLTSMLLEAIASKDPVLLAPLAPALEAAGAAFSPVSQGKWAFVWNNGSKITAGKEQKLLFFKGCDGTQGNWSEEGKALAKLWVVCLANTLQQEGAMLAQEQFLLPKVRTYFTVSTAKGILFADNTPDTGWAGAVRAAYLSFAANLPAVAAKQLAATIASTKSSAWSKDWCLDIIKSLTFGPKIAIYPERYRKIRPVIEQLFGVDLPDMASDLAEWRGNFSVVSTSNEPDVFTTSGIQQVLVDLGYDLGPKGADGVMGNKTQEALHRFQDSQKLISTGRVDPVTQERLLGQWRAGVCQAV